MCYFLNVQFQGQRVNEPNTVTYIEVKRLAIAGHLVRANSDRTIKKIFNTKPDGVRRDGRPKLRWEDGVEHVMRILEIKNWKKMQLFAVNFILLQDHCTCFGRCPHSSSGVRKTLIKSSGTGHIIVAATFFQSGQVWTADQTWPLSKKVAAAII